MCKKHRGVIAFVSLAGLLTADCAWGAESNDAILKRIKALDQVTGTQAMQGALKMLQDDKEGAKKVIAAALPMAQAKKKTLSYNAALVLGLLAADMKDMPKSEAFFRVCMEKAAKLQSPDRLLQAYGGLIDLYFDQKKFADSARICRELLELKTDDGKPRIVLTAKTTPLGEFDYDETNGFDLTKRVRSGVHRLLIQALAKEGRYEEALKLTDNLIKAKDHWLERQLKGWVLREAGKYGEAAKVFEDVIERVGKDKDLDPEEKESYAERYRYALSNVYLDMNRIDLASAQLEQLLAKKPDDPGYNNDLGYIWADNNMKLAEAEKMIRKALELDRKRRKANPKITPETDRDNGAYLDSLGWVLFKEKKLEEAKKVMLEAVKDKANRHIEIFDHLGDVLMALGEKADAVSAWRKGLEFVGDTRRELERKAIVQKKIEMNK